jgi:DNA ligase D-like protein (predicted ligase)
MIPSSVTEDRSVIRQFCARGFAARGRPPPAIAPSLLARLNLHPGCLVCGTASKVADKGGPGTDCRRVWRRCLTLLRSRLPDVELGCPSFGSGQNAVCVRARCRARSVNHLAFSMASKPRPRPASAPAPGAVRGLQPANQAPQLCTLVRQPPKGSGWFSEVKFDGYRFLAWKGIAGVRLVTRNGHDWADRLPVGAASIGALKASHIVLDGELVAVRPDGASSFPDLQAALSAGADDRLIFYAFDLLALDGWDLRNCKLLDRKRLLRAVSDWDGQLRYSDHNEGEADALHQEACRLGLEGIVCKRDEPYRAGRSGGWVKAKCLGREEMVVLGWTLPSGTRTGIGALHLGYYDPEGHMQYAGGAGTGFSDRILAEWRARLEPLAAPPPQELLFAGDPLDRLIQWVRPELIVEVSYSTWSGAGRVRHPVYLGIRKDKAARQVVRPVADPEAPRQVFKPRAAPAGGSSGLAAGREPSRLGDDQRANLANPRARGRGGPPSPAAGATAAIRRPLRAHE